MKKLLLAAASVALLAGPALAQGNSPYNRSGPQAGGPLGGMERAGGMGAAPGAGMEQGAMAQERPMMRKRTMKRKKMHRRMKRDM